MDRLLADDARDRAVLRADRDALADEDLRVPAADADEAQEARVLDVGDDEADLVDVADDRQRRAAAGAGHARHTEPMTSVVTSAKADAASAKARAGAVS